MQTCAFFQSCRDHRQRQLLANENPATRRETRRETCHLAKEVVGHQLGDQSGRWQGMTMLLEFKRVVACVDQSIKYILED